MNFETILSHILPDPVSSRNTADALRKEHPGLSAMELAHQALHSSKMKAATVGAATGVMSSPFTMIPAALADMTAVLKMEGSLVGVIAALLDPTALDNPSTIRADVLSIVFPAAASQALRQLGIKAGERLSQAAMRKYATEDLLRTVARLATRYLGKQLTREAIITKAVPLVGMGIGAGWNWLEMRAIGQRAIHYYNKDAIGPSHSSVELGKMRKYLPKIAKFLPGLPKS